MSRHTGTKPVVTTNFEACKLVLKLACADSCKMPSTGRASRLAVSTASVTSSVRGSDAS